MSGTASLIAVWVGLVRGWALPTQNMAVLIPPQAPQGDLPIISISMETGIITVTTNQTAAIMPFPLMPMVPSLSDLAYLHQQAEQIAMPTELEKEELKKCAFVRLECTSHGHNKFYEVRLVAAVSDNKPYYTVSGAWGKISATPEVQVKYSGANFALAAATYGKLKAEKSRKDYVIKTELTGEKAAKRLGLGHIVAQTATDTKAPPTTEARKSRFTNIDV